MRVFFERLGLKLCLVVFSFGIPLMVLLVLAGGFPRTLDMVSLEAWSPIRTPGWSTSFLVGISARFLGGGQVQYPTWFTTEDQGVLLQAKDALRSNRLQEAMGHLVVLSGRLEEQSRTFEEFLPIIVPHIFEWLLAYYFAPFLLVFLLLVVGLFVFGPWLMRRLYDFVKLLMTLVLVVVFGVIGVMLCVLLVNQKALIFFLIEYLTFSVILLLCSRVLVWFWCRRRGRVEGGVQVLETERQQQIYPRREMGRMLRGERIAYERSLGVCEKIELVE